MPPPSSAWRARLAGGGAAPKRADATQSPRSFWAGALPRSSGAPPDDAGRPPPQRASAQRVSRRPAAPRHPAGRAPDLRSWGGRRTGRRSGPTSTSTVRARPGCRRTSPVRSSVSTIWRTAGGLRRKWRWMSISAGRRRVGVDGSQVLALPVKPVPGDNIREMRRQPPRHHTQPWCGEPVITRGHEGVQQSARCGAAWPARGGPSFATNGNRPRAGHPGQTAPVRGY